MNVVFQVLDRVPTIDSLSKEGQKLRMVNGEIEFKDVHFRYPARKDVKVLQGLNLKIKHGETVALVGGSGCGKSTCLQLIQRLYDPLQGQVSSKIFRNNLTFFQDFQIFLSFYTPLYAFKHSFRNTSSFKNKRNM